jgi:hypothetical protein
MLDTDFEVFMEQLNNKIKTEAFANGLTREGSLDVSFLVSKFGFSKVDVKRYMNYYYNYMISQYTANQGSLDKPIGLQEFGYSIAVDDDTSTNSDKRASSQNQ